MTSPVVVEIGKPTQFSASTQVEVKPGQLLGVFVSNPGGGSLTVYDNAASAAQGKIVDTFTPTQIGFYPLPFAFLNGCYCVISGTLSVTVSTQV